MSHTPGPWVILDLREKGDECITIASSATPQALCRVRNEVTGLPLNKEDVANEGGKVGTETAAVPKQQEAPKADAPKPEKAGITVSVDDALLDDSDLI